ncbi:MULTISPECIES: hypothetical protein [unclassified Bradyrhizobium]|uniref:hypothetical protein n=1 Tax=unclassified Bradyrhizobium TaxID=2631580 RepID=UPI0029162484|nr:MULTISPECIES: hypothetical protein [unclassified Bradyrhizobium]
MPLDKISDGTDLLTLRKALGFNQAEMAKRMGLGARAYFTLEQEPASVNIRHVRLAEYVALSEAVARGDRDLAPRSVAKLADAFAKLRAK